MSFTEVALSASTASLPTRTIIFWLSSERARARRWFSKMEAAASQRDYVVDASLSLIRRLGSSSARRVGWSVPRGVGGGAAITPAKAKVGTHLYTDPLSRGDVWAYLFLFFFGESTFV